MSVLENGEYGTLKESIKKIDLGKSYESTGKPILSGNDAAEFLGENWQPKKGKIAVMVLDTQLRPLEVREIGFNPKKIEKLPDTIKQIINENRGRYSILGLDASDSATFLWNIDHPNKKIPLPAVADIFYGDKNGFSKLPVGNLPKTDLYNLQTKSGKDKFGHRLFEPSPKAEILRRMKEKVSK
jgi:hypothetical protein